MENEKRLIDANVIIRDLTAMMSEYDAISLDGMIRGLTQAPTVDAVEVVHGRWIGETGGYMWRQNCSVCNEPVYNKMKPYYNYCPYCGAKMDGGNEDGKIGEKVRQ